MPESTDSIILQIKIEDSAAGKNVPKAKQEVESLATSIVGLSKANKQLREERNKLDTSTEEGAKRIQELNKLIDQNNDLIKQNSSNLEKQRMNVGNYKRGVTDALKELRIGGVNVGEVVDKLSKANEDLFQGMIQGYKQSGIQAKLFGNAARTALTLTGIGLFVVALGAIVAYWDDITDAIGFTSKAHTQYYENAQKEIDAYNKSANEQKGILEALGASRRELLIFDLFQKRRELHDQQKLLDEREQDLLKAEHSGWVTAMLKAEDAKKAVEDQKKAVSDLMLEVEKYQALLANEDLTEAQGDSEKRKKASEDRVKDTQKEYDELSQKHKEHLQAKKQEEQNISDELKAINEEEYSRRTEQIDIVNEQQLEQMSDAHRKELGSQKQHNANLKQLYIEDANAKRDAAFKKLDAQKAIADAEINLAATVGNTLRQLAGKNKGLAIAAIIIEKAAAIAGIISNTAIANLKAIAASPLTLGQPWVAINTGTAIAAGVGVATQAAASISDINSAKFAQGGEYKPNVLVGGRSHAEGGTKYIGQDGNRFEVEKGEGIYILKRSAQAELNYLSTLNQKHGGRSFGQKTWYAAQGGQIETRDAASRSQQNNTIARMIAASIASMPRPVVYVEDIRSSVDRAVDIESSASPLNT